MSITLLIKQNVYRYYALTDDNTLSLLFTRHRVRFLFPRHLFVLFLTVEAPPLFFTPVISH